MLRANLNSMSFDVAMAACCDLLVAEEDYTSVLFFFDKKTIGNAGFEKTKWTKNIYLSATQKQTGVVLCFAEKNTMQNYFPKNDDENENFLQLILNIANDSLFKQLLLEENKLSQKTLQAIARASVLVEGEASIEGALQQMCNLIPTAWQYPEYTCVKVSYEEKVFCSANFKETVWFQKENFVSFDNKKGSIQVFYLKKFPEVYDGAFLKEETEMLASLAKLLSGFINNFKGREIYSKVVQAQKTVEHKPEDLRKALTKVKEPLQLFFNKQVLDKYIYLEMMKYKVKNILFVSTLYDAFMLENEDSFFEQFMGEIYQYSLFSLPRITGVSSPEEALRLIASSNFDLVILMVGIDSEAPIELSKEIKQFNESLPVYLLLNQKNDIKYFEELVPNISTIDKLFVWNGNSQILFAIVKSIEDSVNVENDTKMGLVRVILLVEDSPLYYSKYLQHLYSIVFGQIQKLLEEEERNEINKISKMRSRPKIIHARNYEEAMFVAEKYKDFLLCVISDVEFDRNGTLDKAAGIDFINYIKKNHLQSFPIVLQSSDSHNKRLAEKMGVAFINKNSEHLLKDLKRFLVKKLGFGDFTFRNQNGEALAVARTLKEFATILEHIPEESLYSQGIENQFSLWLMSRGEIKLAKTINPIKITDFANMEEFRQSFLKVIHDYTEEKRRGKILNFDEVDVISERNIVSLANGSLGGKGRGLAFINTLIYNLNFSHFSKEISIKTPITAIIGTDEFDRFMDTNKLHKIAFDPNISYTELREHFVQAELSPDLLSKLERFLSQVNRPLAVRSSSMSEDSVNQPFAGVFDTYVVPNNNMDRILDLENLTRAIKLVYASVYSETSRAYFKTINLKIEEEKMAVILQELVGAEYDNYYYPNISGVAQSYNYYPVSYMKPEEGFAMAAVGLGYYVVGGENSYRFSPRYPNIEILSTKDLIRSTQVKFYALDLSRKEIDYLNKGEDAPLETLDISDAERHGSIKHCVSVYNPNDDRIEAGLGTAGPRIINFSNILEYGYIPLAALIDELLSISKEALGSPVEIEWAVDLSRTKNDQPTFYLLQIKPMVATQNQGNIKIEENIDRTSTLLYTESSLGNGEIDDIYDLIYVDTDRFDKLKTLNMAKEIEYLNNIMLNENRQYILIGPGRWGTRDQFLGIPVAWSQISKAKIIVEISLPDFPLDSSLGSHFFHNVTSMNIGYFSVQDSSLIDFINWDIIGEQKEINRTEYFRHIRFEKPLRVLMNGKERKGIIKQGVGEEE